MGRWLEQWSLLDNKHEETLWHWLSPLTKEDFYDKSVLDAGCGNGGNAEILSQYAKSITAVDLESTASPMLHRKTNIQYHQADIENLDFYDEFDISISVGVLHHLNNPKIGFTNLVNSTKSGGYVAVWVYSREGNSFMINVVEPLKTFVLLKLPKPVFRLVAHISTIIGYTLAFSPIYLSNFPSLPYCQYFKFWRSYSYERNYMNVYDKLNAPVTHFISRKQIEEWGSLLKNPKLKDFNGVSWTLVGTK